MWLSLSIAMQGVAVYTCPWIISDKLEQGFDFFCTCLVQCVSCSLLKILRSVTDNANGCCRAWLLDNSIQARSHDLYLNMISSNVKCN